MPAFGIPFDDVPKGVPRTVIAVSRGIPPKRAEVYGLIADAKVDGDHAGLGYLFSDTGRELWWGE